jgi:signal transduction histidine kinase
MRQRWIALALPMSSVIGFALTVALDIRTPSEGRGVELVPGDGWTFALNGLVLAGLAAIILLRDARQRFGWLLGALGLFWVLDGLAQSYIRYGITDDDILPGMATAFWFLHRFGALLPVSVAALLLIFPTGRFLGGRWGVAGRISLGIMGVVVLIVLVAPTGGSVEGVPVPAGLNADPTSLPMSPELAASIKSVALGVAVAAFVIPMATVVVRYRRSSGLERDRMRWLLWSVFVMALTIGGTFGIDDALLVHAVLFLVMILPGVAMTIAIVAPRVVSIEELLNRTLVYGGLWVLILAIDLAVLAGLALMLGDALEERQVVFLVLLLSAVLYAPLRLRLWGGVRRLTLGDRENPYDAVAGLASTLETADEGPEQLAAVAGAVASAFGIDFVSVEVDRAGGERLVATHGTAPRETRTLPITYRDAEVGRLVLPARGVRSRLSRRDEQLLGDLVRQAATAARTSRLADELQESRERLVVAREEERRRIRRDLHDGLGPALSGVVFQLESARLLMDRDPAAAERQLAATSTQVQDVVTDVRRLVHDLRPPALDDRGLVGALRQQAERLTGDELRVDVHAPDLDSLPAAVEVAAYRIVGEALTNVSRHAAATATSVGLAIEDGQLVVEVADDGVGIPADAEAGVGLVSLRERAAELGGRCEITCPPWGGTVVKAWLPLRRSS